MAKLKHSIHPFFGDSLSENRHHWQLTQESMDELLLISSRVYRELEKGHFSCSTVMLILFLTQMPAEDAGKVIRIWTGILRDPEDNFCNLSFRRPKVLHIRCFPQQGWTAVYPVCPKCGVTMEREHQSFCDRCGQRLTGLLFPSLLLRIKLFHTFSGQ